MAPRDPSFDDTDALAHTVDTGNGTDASRTVAGEEQVHLPTGNARYIVGDLLGRGGMGDVVVAIDAQIGRDVAIKRMRDVNAASIARFLREARIQGRLDHPAIVPVHELAIDEEGRPYFVMKRLTGTTLADILSDPGDPVPRATVSERRSRQRLLRAFTDVCLAVEFAHTRGVIHRDLKPANIMLGDFGEVYVLDWGIAHLVREDDAADLLHTQKRPRPGEKPAWNVGVVETEAGAVLGTVGYMAPEQLRGWAIDHRADVYALGCILFEILARQPLHRPGDHAAALGEYDARPSSRSPAQEVPPELDALCVAATAEDPGKRPASAREVGESVQRFLDGDRDVGQRRRLAAEHLALARSALVGGEHLPLTTTSPTMTSPTMTSIARRGADRDNEIARRNVMQHAGRALALDPSSADAADLVTRMILEPPRETPAKVQAELSALEDADLRSQGRFAMAAYIIYLTFVPIMVWVGVRDVPTLTLGTLAIVANIAFAFVLMRKRTVSTAFLYTMVGSNVVLLAIAARLFSPFLVAPGIAAATMFALVLHPRFGRPAVLVIALCGAILVPWLLERIGVLSPTIGAHDGALVMRTANGSFRLPHMEIALAFYVIALLICSAFLSRGMSLMHYQSRRAAYLQAWHMRQLVPMVAAKR